MLLCRLDENAVSSDTKVAPIRNLESDPMTAASYLLAALSMLGAAGYLFYKSRGYISAASMLLGFLLLLYGPAYLVFMLYYNQESVIYRELAKAPYFDEATISLNFALSIMYLGCVAGIELVDRIARRSNDRLNHALESWNAQSLKGCPRFDGLLIAANLALAAFMIWVSIREHHLAIVSDFLDTASSQIAKSEYRLQHAGSNNYAYRIILGSTAPFFVIWGILEGHINRNRALLALSVGLFLLTLFGRVETLSRAPVALLFLQLGLAALLCFRNRPKWQVVAGAFVAIIAVFYPLIELTIPETARQGTAIRFFFWRTFFISNEVLLEYFSAIPYYLGHTWGSNLRPLAFLLNMEFRPTYEDVSLLWHGQPGSTSNSMFIADGWAEFSFVGVAAASILAGTVCRLIDVAFVARGKSTMTISILACSFVGIVHLMIGSIQSAMLSGGLASVPLILLSILKLSNLSRGSRGAMGRVRVRPAPNQTGDPSPVSGMTDK
jgi:hypothetical protein